MKKAGMMEDEYGLHMLSLSILLTSTLGPEFIAWDYAALRSELEDRWGNVGVQTWERVMALTVLHAHCMAWKEWEVFENMVAVIIGEMPIFSYVQPPEPEELAIAIEVFGKVDSRPFSEEVKDYIVVACLNDGLWYLDGTPMEMAQSSLTEYDLRLGIDRDVGSVARALQDQEGFYADPDTAAEVQANKVREVQLALKRYTDAADKQLRSLS
tara:strand:- start:24 stop:659 length:636 start_codon:yes stop_codon:yes gene_type:complete